jgi:hypothetical protein
MYDAAAFAAKHGFAFEEGAVAEGAESLLLNCQKAFPGQAQYQRTRGHHQHRTFTGR